MAHRVLIPTPLRPYTGQQDAVEVEGATVGEVLSSLTSALRRPRRHLYSDDGKLRTSSTSTSTTTTSGIWSATRRRSRPATSSASCRRCRRAPPGSGDRGARRS